MIENPAIYENVEDLSENLDWFKLNFSIGDKIKISNIDLNRKMLSQIAILDASTFKSLIEITN